MGDKIELGEPDVIRNEDNILWLRAQNAKLQAVVDAAQQLVEQGLPKRTTRDQWNAWHILKDALEDDDA